MPISAPKRRTAFKPIGRLRQNPLHAGRKGVAAGLNLTAMVDMFTVIVIFLLQSFSANGEIMFIQKEVTMPTAEHVEELTERGVVITLYDDNILLEGKEVAKGADLDPSEQTIPSMVERLNGIREREEKIAAATGKKRDPNEPFDGSIIVQADENVDFMLVRKVIASMNDAGWAKVKFAVKGEASNAEDPSKALRH
ncbi:MAG TPA: biopolymer transporter ExbD [Myxococcota bacterium]|nr:biopolymer transporter ExbD [Myxococcota bacterium]